MLLEILDVLRIAAIAIIETTFKTGLIVGSSIIQIFRILASSVGVAHPLETITVILIFSSIGYIIYRFLWNSFKTLVVFLLVVIFLFVLTIIIL